MDRKQVPWGEAWVNAFSDRHPEVHTLPPRPFPSAEGLRELTAEMYDAGIHALDSDQLNDPIGPRRLAVKHEVARAARADVDWFNARWDGYARYTGHQERHYHVRPLTAAEVCELIMLDDPAARLVDAEAPGTIVKALHADPAEPEPGGWYVVYDHVTYDDLGLVLLADRYESLAKLVFEHGVEGLLDWLHYREGDAV